MLQRTNGPAGRAVPRAYDLTPAGCVALEYVECILQLSSDLDERVKEVTGQEIGPLAIGASTTVAEFLLPRIIGEFKSLHPGIVPQLIVANSEVVQARVNERALDVGFIEGDSHLRTLVTDVCCEDELQVVCVPTHPLARRESTTVGALPEYPYVSREPGSASRSCRVRPPKRRCASEISRRFDSTRR